MIGKKLLSIALALSMLLSIMPTSALAAGPEEGLPASTAATVDGQPYETLEAAIAAAPSGATVSLAKDVTITDGILFNRPGETVTLDVNSHTFTVENGSNVNSRGFKVQSGTLNVTGPGKMIAVGSGTTKDSGSGAYGVFRVEAEGVLHVEGVTLENSRPWGLNVKVCGGEATLTDVVIQSSYGGGIEVTEANLGGHSKTGKAVLTNCTVDQTGYFDHCSSCVSVSGGSELIVNGGTYTSAGGVAVYVFSSGGIIQINDGSFCGGKYAAVAEIDTNTYPGYEGSVCINGGEFTGAYRIASPASMAISGGTFSEDPSAYLAPDCKVVKNENGTFSVVAKDYVAQTGGEKYESLEAALKAVQSGETITLLKNAAGNGVSVPSGTNMVVDLNGFTYKIDGKLAGSTGYKSQGFQLLKDSTITFKNGTLDAGTDAAMLIQNYCNMTLENVELIGGTQTQYVLSNNCGDVNIIGSTSITATEGNVAFDVCKFGSYTIPNVTVNTTGTVTGKLELTGGNLTIENINHVGVIDRQSGTISVSGGTFNADPTPYLAEGCAAEQRGGVYQVVPVKLDPIPEVVLPDSTDIPAESKQTVTEAAAGITAPVAAPKATAEETEKAAAIAGEAAAVEFNTYLEIRIEGYQSEPQAKSFALDITPMAVPTVRKGDSTVALGAARKVKPEAPVLVTIPLPAGFAAEDETLYVVHTKDNGDIFNHEVQVKGGAVSFTNENGFSRFEVRETPVKLYVAEIGGRQYETLAAAVADAADGQTIRLLRSAAETLNTGAKNLTITADAAAKPTLTGLVTIGTGKVVLENLRIVTPEGAQGSLVKMEAADTAATIRNCELVITQEMNGAIDMQTAGRRAILLEGNTIDCQANCVRAFWVTNNDTTENTQRSVRMTIKGNTVTGNWQYGVFRGVMCDVIGNTFISAITGPEHPYFEKDAKPVAIHYYACQKKDAYAGQAFSISGNTFEKNEAAIAIYQIDKFLTAGGSYEMTGNTFDTCRNAFVQKTDSDKRAAEVSGLLANSTFKINGEISADHTQYNKLGTININSYVAFAEDGNWRVIKDAESYLFEELGDTTMQAPYHYFKGMITDGVSDGKTYVVSNSFGLTYADGYGRPYYKDEAGKIYYQDYSWLHHSVEPSADGRYYLEDGQDVDAKQATLYLRAGDVRYVLNGSANGDLSYADTLGRAFYVVHGPRYVDKEQYIVVASKDALVVPHIRATGKVQQWLTAQLTANQQVVLQQVAGPVAGPAYLMTKQAEEALGYEIQLRSTTDFGTVLLKKQDDQTYTMTGTTWGELKQTLGNAAAAVADPPADEAVVFQAQRQIGEHKYPCAYFNTTDGVKLNAQMVPVLDIQGDPLNVHKTETGATLRYQTGPNHANFYVLHDYTDGKIVAHCVQLYHKDGNQPQDFYCIKTAGRKFEKTEYPLPVKNVAQIGAQPFDSLQEAVNAATDGQTIQLLKDVANTGTLNLPANVTLDGGGKKITGDSRLSINTAGGTIRNVIFENNANGEKLTPVYAKDLHGTVTITGCQFINSEYESLQLLPVAGANVVVTDNIFRTDTMTQTRYVHIESDYNVDFSATVTGNKMYDEVHGVQGTGKECGALEVYFFTDPSKIHISHNYIEDPRQSCILMNRSTNVGEMIYPLYRTDAMEESDMIEPVAAIKARYDGQYFNTLRAALNAATDGQTIQLLKDVTDFTYTLSRKSVTIDLNNYKITTTFKQGITLKTNSELNLIGTGTVQEPEGQAWFAPIVMKGNSVSGTTKVSVGPNVTLKGWSGLMIDGNKGNDHNIVADIQGTLIGVNDTSNSSGIGLYVNGTINLTGATCPKITLNGARLTGTSNGMYLAGYADTTITDSSIIGDSTGIEIRAGKLAINGDATVITGNGTPTSVTPNGNGSTSEGVGLAIAQHSTKLPVEVTVNGGTISGYSALYQSNPENNPADDAAKMNTAISGGKFNAINGGTVAVYGAEGAGKVAISGGSFSSDPSAYAAEGYVGQQVGDSWEVVVNTAVAKVGAKYYDTLQEALNAATDGQTVTLLKDVSSDTHVYVYASGTLDLNQHKLSISGNNCLAVIPGVELTLTNGTFAGGYIQNQGTVNVVSAAIQGGASFGAVNNLKNSVLNIDKDSTIENLNGGAVILNAGSTVKTSGTLINRVVDEEVISSVNGDQNANITVLGGKLKATGEGGAGIIIGPGCHCTVSGGEIIASGYAVSGNGNWADTVINITGGKLTAGVAAIYHPQKGELNISGDAILTGETGVQLCSGTASISGGEIHATGADERAKKTGDGPIPDGAAISVVNRAYPGGLPTINITGGKFTSDQNEAVLAYTWAKNTASEWADAKSHLTVSGGSFSSDPSAYVADGMAAHFATGSDWTIGVADKVETKVPASGELNTIVTVKPGAEAPAEQVGVKFSSDATNSIRALAGDSGVELRVKDVTAAGKPDASPEAVRVFDLSLVKAGTETKVDFRGNTTVELPYVIHAGDSEFNYAVYYVSETGEKTLMENALYADGVFRFNTTHFSVYTIEQLQAIEKQYDMKVVVTGADTHFDAGETVTAKVYGIAKTAAAEPMGAFQFTVTQPTGLTLTGIACNPALNGANDSNTLGTVVYSCNSNEGVALGTGDGTLLATVTYTVNTNAVEGASAAIGFDTSKALEIVDIHDAASTADASAPVTVTLHNLTVTLNGGNGTIDGADSKTLYAKYGAAGLYTNEARTSAVSTDTALTLAANTGYRLAKGSAAEPLWKNGDTAYNTFADVAAVINTANASYTLQTTKTYTVTFAAGANASGTAAPVTVDGGTTWGQVSKPDFTADANYNGVWMNGDAPLADSFVIQEDLTATFVGVAKTFAFTHPDTVTNVTGLTADSKATYGKAVTFQVTPPAGTLITSVSYTVGGANSTTLTAANGVYTIEGVNITGDIAVEVSSKTYVTITFASGTGVQSLSATAYAYTNEATLFTTVGETELSGAFTVPTAAAAEGYRLADEPLWSNGSDGMYQTSALGTSATFTADTTLTAQAVKQWTVTFAAGANGSITGTATKVVDEGYEIKSGDLPAYEADPGYVFDQWNEAPVGHVVDGNITFTAQFQHGTYTITLPEAMDGVTFTVEGAVEVNNTTYTATHGTTVTITMKAPQGSGAKVTELSYQIGTGDPVVKANANGITEHTITLEGSKITGAVSITMTSSATVNVTVRVGANGKVNGTTSGTVSKTIVKGTALTEDDFVIVPDAGYVVDTNNIPDAGTALNEDASYEVTFMHGTFTVTLPAGLTGNTTATHGTSLVITPTGVVSSVYYQTEGGEQKAAVRNEDGTYTIPGADIIGDLTVTAESIVDADAAWELVGNYKGASSGKQLAILRTTQKAKGTLALDGYGDLFWSSAYSGYAYIVNTAETANTLSAKLALSSNAVVELAYGGDTNRDGHTTGADSAIINAALYQIPNLTYRPDIRMRLEMDVNGDKAVSTQDIMDILCIAVGKTPGENK